jgi:hypothetical protein
MKIFSYALGPSGFLAHIVHASFKVTSGSANAQIVLSKVKFIFVFACNIAWTNGYSFVLFFS